MNLLKLRDFTTARVALGASGVSLPTRDVLEFQMAHAKARDAVHALLDVRALAIEGVAVRSAARNRAEYLRRPDLGRRLGSESLGRVRGLRGEFDVVFAVVDGLSAIAVERHASPVLRLIREALDWRVAPVFIVKQGRVAIGDEIGVEIGAALSVVLIGERPGLSSPDSLGIYITWEPRAGRTDAERNCISNIHAAGLGYEAAAGEALLLMKDMRARRVSGVELRRAGALDAP